MPRGFYKHKLILDEAFYLRHRLPLTNSRFDIKHVSADFHKAGSSDPEVYELACQEGRLIVTYNIRDFTPLATRSLLTGVIGVSPNLPIAQVDTKLTALLIRAHAKDLVGKLTVISGETTV